MDDARTLYDDLMDGNPLEKFYVSGRFADLIYQFKGIKAKGYTGEIPYVEAQKFHFNGRPKEDHRLDIRLIWSLNDERAPEYFKPLKKKRDSSEE